MKIVYYTTLLSRSGGGVPVAAAGLAHALVDMGVDITVIGGADENFEQDRILWGDLPIVSHSLKNRYGFDLGVFAEIARLKPDLMHLHGIWTSGSIYGVVAAFSGTPLVVSPHGMLEPWILSRSKPLKAVHSTLFERPMLRRAYVHALNQAEFEAASAYMPELCSRTFVLPNGVGSIEAVDADQARSGFLYIGRLHAKKQVLELVRTWRNSEWLSSAQLTVAGSGDKDYESELTALTDETANIRYVGPLYGKAKADALRAAQYLILPSLSEGLPMTVLEALQYGCVPLITDACNLPELIRGGIAERIAVDFSDFEAVAASCLAWPEAEFERRSNAALSYAQRYLWRNIARSMLDQYQRVVDEKWAGKTWSR